LQTLKKKKKKKKQPIFFKLHSFHSAAGKPPLCQQKNASNAEEGLD
jgi:hypothetical protein